MKEQITFSKYKETKYTVEHAKCTETAKAKLTRVNQGGGHIATPVAADNECGLHLRQSVG